MYTLPTIPMFERFRFPDLPSPAQVQTIKPDLENFMQLLHGKYSEDLQLAMKDLEGKDRMHADQAYRELSTVIGAEKPSIGNTLDDGRRLMVQDLYSLLTKGRLTKVPEVA